MAEVKSGRVRDVTALRLFARVARLGSFSAAAREGGLSASQASRVISDLEADLGARLLTRTTRAVMPTETGTEFLARVDSILTALDEAEYAVRDGGDFRGLLRLSMPTSSGVRMIFPLLPGFAEQHPDLHIQVLLEDRRQDLVRDAVDVAIRFGRQPDSGATTKLIATVPRVVLAAPSYLARAGRPETPEDLSKHRIIAGPASASPGAWTFERDGRTVVAEVQANFSTNENEGAIAAAVAGLGITSMSTWACGRELANGSLVQLFADWTSPTIPVCAYFPMGRATRAAGRAIVDYLKAKF